jgi:hypothetical protein
MTLSKIEYALVANALATLAMQYMLEHADDPDARGFAAKLLGLANRFQSEAARQIDVSATVN